MLGWAFGRACSKHLSHAHQFGTKLWVNLVRNFEGAAHNGYINKGFWDVVVPRRGVGSDEAIRRLPVVHAEVEALFDQERSTPNSVRAKSIVRERLGEWHAEVFGSKGTICA